MKVGYFTHLDLRQENGVTKKVKTQVMTWHSLGADVTWCNLGPPINREQVLIDSKINFKNVNSRHIIMRLADVSISLMGLLRAKPDVIYVRFEKFYPQFFLLNKIIPLVYEINTDDITESDKFSSTVSKIYHRLSRRLLKHSASGFVFMTKELMDKLGYREIPSSVISNPIDVTRGSKSFIAKADSSRYSAVFIGSGDYAWHGVDKLVELARLLPDLDIHVIGDFPSLQRDRKPENLIPHGFLSYDKYTKLLDSADVGLGTFALHRKGMQEACPLKVREYLQFGLPVILPYLDTDFTEDLDYVLRLPNEEQVVSTSYNLIMNFIRKWKGRRVESESLSNYSVFDKEIKRLEFFQKVYVK